MKAKPKRSPAADRARISSEPHEIKYAGKQLGRGGEDLVREAKKVMGPYTSRAAVMSRAKRGE